MSEKTQSWWLFAWRANKTVKAKLGLLIVAGVLALFASVGSMAWLFYTKWKMGIHEEQLVHEKIERERLLPHEKPFDLTYELRDMSVSLTSKKGTSLAYAKFSIVMDCQNESVKKSLNLHRAELIDALNEAARSLTREEVFKSGGVEKFKSAWLGMIKKKFGAVAPRDVMIQDWLVN